MDKADRANQQMQLRTMETIDTIKQVLPMAFFSRSWSFIQMIPKIMPTTGIKNETT